MLVVVYFVWHLFMTGCVSSCNFIFNEKSFEFRHVYFFMPALFFRITNFVKAIFGKTMKKIYHSCKEKKMNDYTWNLT